MLDLVKDMDRFLLTLIFLILISPTSFSPNFLKTYKTFAHILIIKLTECMEVYIQYNRLSVDMNGFTTFLE